MVTARAKSRGPTTFEVWRQTHAILQNRKVKPPASIVDKFVKRHRINDLVHKTSRSGLLYVTDLFTGLEEKIQLKFVGVKANQLHNPGISSRRYCIIGVDPEIQRKLVSKFLRYQFTFDEVLYCQEHPEFLKRLLSHGVDSHKLTLKLTWHYQLTLQQLIDDHTLLEPLPGEERYQPPPTIREYPEELQSVLRRAYQLEQVTYVSKWYREYGQGESSQNHIHRYKLSLLTKYLTWGDLLNRGLVSMETFLESE